LSGGSLQREGDVAFRVRGKGNKERVVGLPRQAIEALDARLGHASGRAAERINRAREGL